MNKGIYIAVVVALFLSCLIAGMGWLTTKQDLETTRVITQQLTAENEQYASALKEVNYRAELANNQNLLADSMIEDLKGELLEANKFGSYWWQIAHPREFQSLDELKAWLAKDDSNSTIYLWGDNYRTVYDCDDYAEALMRNALLAGYLISIAIEGTHMLNSTIIGNEIYLIEPQTDEVKFWGSRD